MVNVVHTTVVSSSNTDRFLASRTRDAAFARPGKRVLGLGLGLALVGGAGYTQHRLARSESANSVAAAELRAKSVELAAMRAEVARMHAGVAALSATVQATTQRIEARQVALAAVLGGHRTQVQFAAAPVSADNARLAALAPGAARVLAPLAALETHQMSLIANATGAARARYIGATAAIERLGLDPHRFVRASVVGMGGPLEPLPQTAENIAGAQSGAQVQDLYQAWTKLGQLSQAAAAIPSRMPVDHFNYTSAFGVRYDPFNGGAALHAGVDMAGAMGEPILAAAPGTVLRAGWANGYGNCIDVDHGHGLATRYGHLSRIMVRAGDRVTAGDQIGRMGSTGRSTGTHLHFEVRVDGRAVDPMPYLRAMPTMAAVQAAATPAAGIGGPALPIR